MGSPRSGSTWLLNLIAADPRVAKIDEPSIGVHLGPFLSAHVNLQPEDRGVVDPRISDRRAQARSYFFNERYASTWRPGLRKLLLSRLGVEVEDVSLKRGAARPLVVIKEPDGSQAADLIMSLLPESKLIFLLRDGRDVVDSELDATRTDGWIAELLPGFERSEVDRLAFIRARAHAWLWRTEITQRAFDQHPPDLRRLVRYEELLQDPMGTLEPLAEWLSLELDRLREAAELNSFDRIPPSERGPGRFARAAKPGGWRESFSDSESALLERIMGPKLRGLNYE